MARPQRRGVTRVIWVVLVILAVLLIAQAFRPTPILVDLAIVDRHAFQLTVRDEGKTRVRERYQVSAPLDGQLVRVELEAGDRVIANETPIARFEPRVGVLLDPRSRAEALARISGAEAAVQEARAIQAQAVAAVEFAVSDLARQRELVETGSGPRLELDRAERDEKQAREAMTAAEEALHRAEFELEVARARLIEPGQTTGDGETASGVPEPTTLVLRSPIDGVVLRVHEESARPLAAGSPIVDLGQIEKIEVVADFLSQDAVKVKSGMRAMISGWGGDQPGERENVLTGQVRVVEPGGYTKVSALGVEEQRVDIVVDPAPPADDWSDLGDGYQVQVRIVIWESEDEVIVPAGALFREGEQWFVFVAKDDRAHRRSVEIGRQNGLEAQVLSGLSRGDTVVMYPSELISDQVAIEER